MPKAAFPLPLPFLAAAVAALAALAATALSLSALRHWWAQRAGRPYELPVNHTGTVLRATAAALAVLTAATAATLAALGIGLPGGARPAHTEAAPTPVRAPLHAPAPAAAPAPAPKPRTIGHPAGGTLQRLADGTHVWLPPQYGYASAAGLDFPAVTAYATDAEADDIFTAFAAHADRGLADPFVLVLPRPDRCGTASQDSGLPDSYRHPYGYRIAPAPSAHALLGLGEASAPCAVREALAHPGRYEAAVGVSATYSGTDDDLPQSGSSPRTPRTPRTPLLLATSAGNEAAAASALRLRDALRASGPGEVRILDGVAPRRRLLALIAGYFTEKLDGPSAPALPSTHPPAHPNHP